MGKYFKLNLVGSCFWQHDNHNEYINKNYESKGELLDTVFFEELPNGIFKEITTGGILIIKNDQDGYRVDYPRGVEIPFSNFKKCSSLEIKLYLSRIKESGLDYEYGSMLDELLVKSQQCELVCDKKKTLEIKK